MTENTSPTSPGPTDAEVAALDVWAAARMADPAPEVEDDGSAFLGAAAVDSGQLLIIDPCYLPADALSTVETSLARGLAVVVSTGGDGFFPVVSEGRRFFTVGEPPEPPEVTEVREAASRAGVEANPFLVLEVRDAMRDRGREPDPLALLRAVAALADSSSEWSDAEDDAEVREGSTEVRELSTEVPEGSTEVRELSTEVHEGPTEVPEDGSWTR